MDAYDAAVEAWIERTLADAPPLPDIVRALIARDFTTTKTTADTPSADAA